MAAQDHLSPQQFWDEPSDPDTGYHVADPEHRESIERFGLRPGRAYRSLGQPGGVYMHHSLAGMTSYKKPGDIWKIDTRGLPLEEDASMAHFEVEASSTPHSVSRRRLTRIGERTDKGIVLHPEHWRPSQGTWYD